ncbi:DUF3800 domain-containing protein [Aneurinibacillus terranovensis]|uniref:DUF3800 domain-containing protein n=1 Tax=Aneurinibacillus terranovensis TaxID=278991 RepID=UPI0003F8CF6B|nr:DUF3800 domain-containing protein [Aneurinibacillus terranovensis]
MDEKNDDILKRVDEELLNEEEDSQEHIELEDDPEKIKKRELERQRLMENLSASNFSTRITKVAYILNRYPSTRNSDVTLMIKYWNEFQGHKGDTISTKDLYTFERLTSISRMRAKIQNEYGLFKSDEKIYRFRRNKEVIEKEMQLLTKPESASIFIYGDESGKNGASYAIVGSVWINSQESHGSIQARLKEWKAQKKEEGVNLPSEFHFTELKKHQLNFYKEFFDLFMSHAGMASFKAVAANNKKITTKKLDEVIFSLYYQLVHLGIEHEQQTGRITLPRDIKYFKDEDPGTDKLLLKELEQELQTRFKNYFDNQVTLASLISLKSNFSELVQIADLFTGSIARHLNQEKNGSGNYKDELAEYIIRSLNLNKMFIPIEDLDEGKNKTTTGDMATLHIFE